VETNDEGLRNSLFGFGYERNNLIVMFLNCKFPKKGICNIVHNGWTKFVPKYVRLRKYQDYKQFLFEHILENTISYADECSGKNQLLVLDLYKEKLFFRWLDKKAEEDKKKWLEQILFHDNMRDVIAALIFSGDPAIETFLDSWWSSESDRERIKHLVRKCQSPVLIALNLKYNHKDHYSHPHTELLLERMQKWFSLQELKKHAQKDVVFQSAIVYSPDLCNFFVSIHSKKELLDLVLNESLMNISDRFICTPRCFGEEFCPKIIKFREK